MIGAITTGAIVGIGVVAVVVLAGIFFAVAALRSPARGQGRLDSAAMRRDAARRKLEEARREAEERASRPVESTDLVQAEGSELEAAGAELATVEATDVEVYAPPVAPPDPVEVGITRRRVLNRGVVAGSVVGLAALGGASVAFLIPAPTKGFGSKVTVSTSLEEIKAKILSDKAPYYVPEGKFYLMTYKPQNEAEAEVAYKDIWAGVKAAGMFALYQKCPHLGCKVPWCQSSQWFECPCHGSQYNKAGEKKGGPAPRGMDRFPIELSGGSVTVDTGKVVLGPPVGVDTISQSPEGPNCV
ncbi:MAG: Rieske 2Fe-2S domain-containing protein [Acidimicrobiia bacterium]|nr:Rieske 2Fe-2S domain-containing protein [Acidimicrobiia bacterium]